MTTMLHWFSQSYTIVLARLANVLEPLGYAFDPGKRIYLGYLLPALLIGLIAQRRMVAGKGRTRRALTQLLSPGVWLHPSTLVDLKLLLANGVLRSLVIAPLLVGPVAVTVGLLELSGGDFRPLFAHGASRVAVAIGYTLALFIADDLTRYLLHRAAHRMPFLWAFHKVHHSARVLTPLALYRSHPVEVVLNGLRTTFTTGAVVALFITLFGANLHAYDMLGINVVGGIFNLAGANLRHSHIWVSYGQKLEHLFISPAQHQLHHSRNPAHFDRNLGAFLAVWDWLGGTLLVTSAKRPMLRFGLPMSEPCHHKSLSEAWFEPFSSALRPLQASSKRRGALRIWALTLAGVMLYACVESSSHTRGGKGDEAVGGGRQTSSVDSRALLQNIGEHVIAASYREFAGAAAALEAAATRYATTSSADDLAAARLAWRKASAHWQEAELYQVGPAGPSDLIPGGEDIRDEIYSWPIVNHCRVDQELVEGNFDDAGAFRLEAINVRGLDALEYLLFSESSSNACAPQNLINSDGSWDALSTDELSDRRARYAATVARLLREQADKLSVRWSASGGNFLAQLATAGTGSMIYASPQEALNALSDGLFYLEVQTKDNKLARVAGIAGCPTATCPDDRESKLADASFDHILANLLGFQRMFHGGAPEDAAALGFDDLLVSLGEHAFASTMAADLATAIELAQALTSTDVPTALESEPTKVLALHAAIARVTTHLKTQFVTLLLLELPQTVQGDND